MNLYHLPQDDLLKTVVLVVTIGGESHRLVLSGDSAVRVADHVERLGSTERREKFGEWLRAMASRRGPGSLGLLKFTRAAAAYAALAPAGQERAVESFLAALASCSRLR